MKKKFFLTFIVVCLFVCVFAISGSAVTYTYNDANGNKLYGYDYNTTTFLISNKTGDGFAKVDANGNALTWYITETQTDADGNKTITVASALTLAVEGDTTNVVAGSIDSNGSYKYASPITSYNVVSANFPDNAGIKKFGFGTFGGNTNRYKSTILFCYCPNTLTEFPFNVFQETNIIVAEIDFETPVTNIPQNFAHAAVNLTSVNIPSTVTIINGSGSQNGAPFYGCESLLAVNFPKNSQLTTLLNSAFHGCKSLASIELPNTITSMGNYTFAYCQSLKEIVIPDSVTTYGERTFQHCYNLEKVWMGANVTNMSNGQSMFWDAKGVKYIYLSDSILEGTESISGSHVFHGTGTKGVIFFTGSYDDLCDLKALLQKPGDNQQRIMHENNLKWDPNISDAEYVQKAIDEGKYYVVYDYNKCEAFYNGEHNIKVEEGNNCSGVCSREGCGKTTLLENPTHTYEWIFNGGKDISYTVAFNAEHKCKFCATANPDEEIVEIGAILYSNGISVDETDYTGIYEQIKVDTTALEAYSSLSGKQFDYGIFALVAGEAQASAPITKGENGKGVAVDQNTVFASFTGTEYTYLRIKITGIPNGGSIFCGAYLVIGDDIVYVSNKQEGKEVNKYTMVTEQA